MNMGKDEWSKTENIRHWKRSPTESKNNENARTRGQKASCGAAKRLLLFTCEWCVATEFFNIVGCHTFLREGETWQGTIGRIQRNSSRQLQQVLVRFRFHVARSTFIHLKTHTKNYIWSKFEDISKLFKNLDILENAAINLRKEIFLYNLKGSVYTSLFISPQNVFKVIIFFKILYCY